MTTVPYGVLAEAMSSGQRTGFIRGVDRASRLFSAAKETLVPRTTAWSMASDHVGRSAGILRSAADGSTGPIAAAFRALADDGFVFADDLVRFGEGASVVKSRDVTAAERWIARSMGLRAEILRPSSSGRAGIEIPGSHDVVTAAEVRRLQILGAIRR